VHWWPFISYNLGTQEGKYFEYSGTSGINEKSAKAPSGTSPVHSVLVNKKMVFFGPVHGKSPQSAKFAQPPGGFVNHVNAPISQLWNFIPSKCYVVIKSGTTGSLIITFFLPSGVSDL
jgi:hypothetical protein